MDEPQFASRREVIVGGLSVASLGSLAGCPSGDGGATDGGTDVGRTPTSTPATTPGEADRAIRGSLVTAASGEAQTLNWLRTSDATSGSFQETTMDALYTIRNANPEGDSIEPEVFPLWGDITTDDQRVYTVELRDNLRWSDPYGEMTAEDWVYMIRNVFQGQDNWAGFTNRGDWFRGGEPIPVEKTGTRTFEIQLPSVDPAYPFRPILQAIFCFPRDLIEPYVEEQDGEGLNQDETVQQLGYTGNLGPYTFERWNRGSEFVATRNDEYYLADVDELPEKWSGAPYFNEVSIRVIKEQSQRLTALKEGEVTSASIPPERVSEFQDYEDTYVVISPTAFQKILIYNMRANGWTPLRRRPVLRALALAVNKQSIAENIFRGFADPAFTFQPRFSKWYDESQVIRTGVGDSYGVDMARNALEEALEPTEFGYDDDTVVGPEGEPVTLTVVWNTGSPTEQTLTQFVKQEYEKIGLGVEIQAVSGQSLQSQYIVNRPPQDVDPEYSAGPFNGGPRDVSTSQKQWDLMTALGFNTFPMTPTDTRTFFERQGQSNFYGYVPPDKLSTLFSEAVTDDLEARRAALAELFGLLSREQPFNFLYMPQSRTGYRRKYVGPSPGFLTGWDSVTYYFKE
ncbi:MAG: ABC transporter substrate-binding protein [Salinirussus sp.]